jgi:hypothetical protein
VFKGMGAGKTDKALIRASKAAPAVSKMAATFLKGFDITMPKVKFDSYQKKGDSDQMKVRKTLRSVSPFKIQIGRKTGRSIPVNTLQKVNCMAFRASVIRNADRAINLCDLDADV